MGKRPRIVGVVGRLVLAISAAGCGGDQEEYAAIDSIGTATNAVGRPYMALAASPAEADAMRRDRSSDAVLVPPPIPGPVPGQGAGAVPPGIDRKIIYKADLRLSVSDFDRAADRVADLIRSHGGYVAESNVQGSPGVNRSGTWTARVPIASYDSFLKDVEALGELESRRSDSQDVSEEFYDLEARIANKRVEEERMIELLKNTAGELKEILEVERELSRVREEAERMVGRQRLLTDLTSLTTVTIALSERTEYVPAAAPSFGERIARAFESANRGLVETVQGLTLAFIENMYTLMVLAIGLLIAYLVARVLVVRFRRRVRTITTPATGSSGGAG